MSGSIFQSCRTPGRTLSYMDQPALARGARMEQHRVIIKISHNVPMPFEHVHHLKPIINIAEENHLVFVGRTAQVRADFRVRASHCAG